MRRIAFSLVMALGLIAFTGLASAAPKATAGVGSIVALKGSATIQRKATPIEAKLKETVQLQDVIETKSRSRAKVLFVDESILTIAPESKASIKEFVYSKEGGGASIFNLIDGKMRAVVGKNKFEVHTATTVAAARGTVIDFETGNMDGKPFTRITCLEGIVDLRGADSALSNIVQLRAGQTVLMLHGGAVPTPVPAKFQRARRAGGEMAGGAIKANDTDIDSNIDTNIDIATDITMDTVSDTITTTTTTTTPPITQEPTVTKTPVKVKVVFP